MESIRCIHLKNHRIMKTLIPILIAVLSIVLIGVTAISHFQKIPEKKTETNLDTIPKERKTVTVGNQKVDSVKILSAKLDSLEKKMKSVQSDSHSEQKKEITSTQSKSVTVKKVVSKGDFCDNTYSYKNGATITVRMVWYDYLFNYNKELRDPMIFKYFDFGCSHKIGISFKGINPDNLPDIKDGYLDLTFYYNSSSGDWTALSAKRAQ